jgi:tRNA A37 N6-isopentenylltransferase MiaA
VDARILSANPTAISIAAGTPSVSADSAAVLPDSSVGTTKPENQENVYVPVEVLTLFGRQNRR